MKILLIFFILCNSILANHVDELNLLDDLENASQISTKTKLNINKTPSIVSVIHAKELKQLGVTNLFEAMQTVPGVQTSIGSGGAKQIHMRGNKSLTRDKLKVMINGISVNNEILGSSHAYFEMPIENIQRIEIIRGPASTIYGSFAHIGVINVITKSSQHKDNIYFVSKSSENKLNLGFTQNIELETMKIALDTSFTNNKNSRDTGPYTYNGGSINQATSFEDFKNASVGGIISFDNDFSFEARILKHKTQSFYGYSDWPITQEPTKLKTTSLFSQLQYAPKISSSLSLDLRLGYKEYTFEGLSQLKPYSSTGIAAYDLFGDGYYKEHVLYTDNALNYSTHNHDLLFGFYASQAEESSQTDYYVNNPDVSQLANVFNLGVKEDVSRKQYALYFNDIYTISDKFIANIGLRYDNYSDVDSNLAHKLALLYNHDEAQNYKFMYQRSFRAPTWLELYGTAAPYLGNPSIKPETIDTYELAYHYKNRLDSYANINVFYSKMKNFITSDASHCFLNDGDSYSYGLELEFRIALFTDDFLQTNYSYVYIEDSDGNNLPFVAKHLANLMYVHHISKNFSAGSKIKYIGKQKHKLTDTRADIAGYATFDQTLTYTHKEFSIQASVKNLFNKDIVDPSPLGNGDREYGTGTYQNDYHRDGRIFWISAQWSFE